jgi:hypothetical protein
MGRMNGQPSPFMTARSQRGGGRGQCSPYTLLALFLRAKRTARVRIQTSDLGAKTDLARRLGFLSPIFL